MAEETFADLGRVEAISRLYEGTPFKPFRSSWFETSGKSYVTTHSRTFIEGIDFDLIYFPLKHLGYKCVVGVTGELYAEFSHPKTMDIRLGVSSKLDFKHISEIWEGVTHYRCGNDPHSVGHCNAVAKELLSWLWIAHSLSCHIAHSAADSDPLCKNAEG